MAKRATKKAKKPTRRTSAKRTQAKRTAPKRSAVRPMRAAAQPKARGKLKLSMLTGSYEIVRALQNGSVQPKGIELSIAR